MGSLHEIPSSLYLHALPHQPHSAQSDAGVTCVEGLLFFFFFFLRLSVSAIKLSTVTASLKLQSTGLEEGAGKRCLESNSMHWFTTSFRLGGRCRKAMLGVWRGVCLLLRPSTSRPLRSSIPVQSSCQRWLPHPHPFPCRASSDRQSLYSQAVRCDPPPPPALFRSSIPVQSSCQRWLPPTAPPLPLSPSSERQSLYSQAVRGDPPPPPPSSDRQSLYSQAVRWGGGGHRPTPHPFPSRPLQNVNPCTVKLSEVTARTPLPLSPSSDRQSVYSQAVRDSPPPPPQHTHNCSPSLFCSYFWKIARSLILSLWICRIEQVDIYVYVTWVHRVVDEREKESAPSWWERRGEGGRKTALVFRPVHALDRSGYRSFPQGKTPTSISLANICPIVVEL